MIESKDRVEQFQQEIAEMKLRDPSTSRDRLWLGVGIALMVIGVVLGAAAYPMSHNTTNTLEQTDAIALGLGGIAATIAGGALFLRYSIAGFLRFWFARVIYEQKAQTDRLLEAADAVTKTPVA